MIDVRDDRDVADVHIVVRRGCWARYIRMACDIGKAG